MRIGYYYGDEAFQDGFGDDERKSGYTYEYYQRLAPYAGWDYTYRYLTRSEAIEALRNGEVDIVAGINKTPQLEKEFLFSSADMGLDGNPLYFAVDENRGDLLAELDQAQEDLLANDPNFLAENRKKYYANSGMTTALTENEHAWLEEKGSITLGYLSDNLPIYPATMTRENRPACWDRRFPSWKNIWAFPSKRRRSIAAMRCARPSGTTRST